MKNFIAITLVSQIKQTKSLKNIQPQLTQEMENPNSPVSLQETEFIGENLPTRKLQVCDFTSELYKGFKEEIIAILHKVFQRREEKIFQLILLNQHYPDKNSRQKYHKKTIAEAITAHNQA